MDKRVEKEENSQHGKQVREKKRVGRRRESGRGGKRIKEEKSVRRGEGDGLVILDRAALR